MQPQSTAIVQPLDDHNQRLLQNVHPPEWTNPTPKGRYHMVVIGAGTAGLVTAVGAAGLGARVALIERSLMGGDCLNAGCVPSKAIIRAAHAAAAVRDAGPFGVRLDRSSPSVDFGLVMERMRKLRAGISSHDSATRFSGLGVDVFLGEGQFAGPDSIRVGDAELSFSKACIATGTRARIPPIPGLAESGALTNETVFSLTELPERLVVIGGGPIGVELAQSFARFGSQVTLIQGADRILPREDADATEIVERSLVRDGVAILRSTFATKVSKEGSLTTVRAESQVDGTVHEVAADRVLVAAGRVPNIEGLGLDAARVRYDDRLGVIVDDRLRTSNRRVYAAGDISSQYKFTHMADAMARIVIGNALFFGRGKASSLHVPWCTYSDPELAHVGLSESEAQSKGVPIDTFRTDMASVDRAVLDSESEGFVKIHCKQGSDKILGATIVARHAGEMISEITAVMTAGGGLKSLAGTIHPYPTQAEAIRKTADAYQRTRLTPGVKRLLNFMLRLHGK